MKIPPDYIITPEILNLLAKIESLRLYFESFPVKPDLKIKLQRISLLKSSLYSARIEGNSLTLEDVNNPQQIRDKQKKIEVFNILEALRYLEESTQMKSTLDQDLILKLHSIVMKDLSKISGSFRIVPSAIFNQAGAAVYATPLPEKISDLISKLLDFANNKADYPVIQSVLTHLIFEKIHPFIDGNGRVGRLLIWAVIRLKNYNFPIFIPAEEYIENNRSDYYYHLDNGLSETGDYIKFMLEAFAASGEKIKNELLAEMEKKTEVILPPRQEEILAIIKDHRNVFFNFIKRRFYRVPSRTLSYDLKKLVEKDLVIKVGKTRGSFYRAK